MTGFVPGDAVPVDDRGLLLGDGLFETVLFKDGRPISWDAHVGRLARGCRALGLPAPDAGALWDAARAAALAEPSARAAVRLTWTCGSGGRGLDRPEPAAPRLLASAAPSPRVETPAALAIVDLRRNARSPTARFKTLAYLDNVLARSGARAAGADEALMLNTDDEVAGCAAANLFWLEGEALVTPALECGALDGTLRAHVIERAGAVGLPCRQVHAPPSAVAEARAAFITNSLIGVRPISRIDGRSLGWDGRIDALARALSDVS